MCFKSKKRRCISNITRQWVPCGNSTGDIWMKVWIGSCKWLDKCVGIVTIGVRYKNRRGERNEIMYNLIHSAQFDRWPYFWAALTVDCTCLGGLTVDRWLSAVAAVTIGSMGVTPPWTMYYPTSKRQTLGREGLGTRLVHIMVTLPVARWSYIL